ncbi:MAG: alpha-ketoglutarate-dependent dioxygenase AlkB [Actinomycetota bacterium]|nr:alpha-ketoglutarate-dependent dioxygenase AlkB [Actinomycetota bacterium]
MVIGQTSLFAAGPTQPRPEATFERTDLGSGAWVEVARDWLRGSDDLLDRLARQVAWHQRRRRMYDRMVDEPRLTHWYHAGAEVPDPALVAFRTTMARRYRVRFAAVGLNYYRDGRDSVAFHADRELRHLDDALVAILTVGAPRPFLLRPYGGGRSIDLRPGPGDVVVMGGACQARWEHAVPKVASGVGPRISASIRWVRRPSGAGGAIGSNPDRQPAPR